MMCCVPVAVGGFLGFHLEYVDTAAQDKELWVYARKKGDETHKAKRGWKKHITTSNNSKWHLNWEKIHSSVQQQFCYPEALFLKNLFPFTIPLLRREMCPRRVEKTNVLESSVSVWDSGAFLFVSPLEPSLPWEPCRPGNKQSFVSTDPLFPAARLQTSTPVLIGKRRWEVRSRGSFLTSTCAFIIAHQNKHRKAGCCGTLVTAESKAFFTNILLAQTL